MNRNDSGQSATSAADPGNLPRLIAAWLFVGIPFAWGVFVTVKNASALFH